MLRDITLLSHLDCPQLILLPTILVATAIKVTTSTYRKYFISIFIFLFAPRCMPLGAARHQATRGTKKTERQTKQKQFACSSLFVFFIFCLYLGKLDFAFNVGSDVKDSCHLNDCEEERIRLLITLAIARKCRLARRLSNRLHDWRPYKKPIMQALCVMVWPIN